MTRAEVVAALTALGWRVRDAAELKRAVEDFQQGWNLGSPALKVDGVVGPATAAALELSWSRRRADRTTASAHFSFAEFACKCGGRYAACRRIRVRRELLGGLEALRHAQGRPIVLRSGYRCGPHNRAVGGAKESQHVHGAACDPQLWLTDTQVRGLRRFSGIGRRSSDRIVRHVDVRHVSGHNPTGGTLERPTIWDYPT